MALISCPECNSQISEFSNNCPNCGFPIKPQSANIVVRKNEGCFLQTLNIGCVIILIVGVLLFVIMMISSVIITTKASKMNDKKKIEQSSKK